MRFNRGDRAGDRMNERAQIRRDAGSDSVAGSAGERSRS
jgi:hypothetical protein